MKRKLKQLSSAALALCLLLTTLPLGVLAANAPLTPIWTDANKLSKKFENGSFAEQSATHWYTNDNVGIEMSNALTSPYFSTEVGTTGINLATASGGTGYFAEICAENQNSNFDNYPINMIWQDVLVKPGTEYAWSLYHRARVPKSMSQSDKDYMAVMIGPVTDDNYAIDKTSLKNSHGLSKDQRAAVEGSPYEPTRTPGSNWEADRPTAFTCATTVAEGWKQYTGSYTVPTAAELTAAGCKTADNGYYVLRFAFVSGPTVYGGSGGNAITGVRFSQAHRYVVDLENVKTDDPAAGNEDATINGGYDYELKLEPEDQDYRLPDNIEIKIGDTTHTVPTDGSANDPAGITFNQSTGILKIPGDLIDGDVTITATGASVFTQVLSGMNTTNPNNHRESDGSFTTTLTPKDGYLMPETFEVKIDGVAYTIKTDGTSDPTTLPQGVTFDPATGEVSITNAAITGDVVITALAIPQIAQELTNLNTSNPANVLTSEGFTTVLTPKPGYRLPQTIEVEMNGTIHTIRTDGTAHPSGISFHPATGKLTIPTDKLDYPVVVRAVADKLGNSQEKAKVVVSISDTNGPVLGKTVTITHTNGQVTTLPVDANGRYTTANLPYGEYTLKIDGMPDLTQTMTVNAPEVRKDLKLGGNGEKIGEVKGDSVIEIGAVGDLAKDEQFNAQSDPTQGFTGQELLAYPQGTGGHLKLELQVANILKNSTPSYLNTAINSIDALAQNSDRTIGFYVDLTIHKYAKMDLDPAYTYLGQLSQIPQLISVDLIIPSNLRNQEDLTVYRYHGARVEQLSRSNGSSEGYQISQDKKTITIYTRQFSLYAIGYKESTGGNGNGGNGNSGYVGGSGGGAPAQPGVSLDFQTNGGSAIGRVNGQKDSKIDLSKYVPIRNGYTFDGWYLDQGLTKPAVTPLVLGDNVTLYAKWTATPRPGQLTDRHVAYLVGRDDGMIHPGASITRAEVATIFFRLLTDELRQSNLSTNSGFSDVKNGSWYNTAISTLTKLNILGGRENGTFDPNAPITRAEFATIAARFSGKTYTGPQLFSDISGHWAANSISVAAHVGWIQGDTNGRFRPNDAITRAEATTLVNRILVRNPEQPSDLHTDMTTWRDNMDTNAWYYLAVQEATNSHDYESKQGTVYESWTTLTQTPNWTTYEK